MTFSGKEKLAKVKWCTAILLCSTAVLEEVLIRSVYHSNVGSHKSSRSFTRTKKGEIGSMLRFPTLTLCVPTDPLTCPSKGGEVLELIRQ